MSQNQKRSLKKYLAFFLGVFLLVVLLFLTPAVQSFIGQTLTQKFFKERGADLSVDHVYINPIGKATFQNLLVRDHQQDTLIFIEEARFNALRLRSFVEGSPDLGSLFLDGLQLNIQKHRGDSLSNMAIFGAKFKNENPKKSLIRARSIRVDDAFVGVANHNNELRSPLFFDNLDMSLKDFTLSGNDVKLKIDKISFNELTHQFQVSKLQSNFTYGSTEMGLSDLEITTPHSKIAADLKLKYPIKGMRDFKELVEIKLDFSSSSLGSNDLKAFTTNIGDANFLLERASLNGTLEDFRVQDIQLGFDETYFMGDLMFKNASNNDIDLGMNINSLTTNFSQWNKIFPNIKSDVFGNLERMGGQTVFGTLKYTPSLSLIDVNIKGFSSEIDLDLEVEPKDEDWYYFGSVSVNDLDLGRLLNQENLSTTSFSIDVVGQGLKFDQLNTSVEGVFDSFGFNGYNYQNIDVNGVFKGGEFKGDLSIDDPNLKMDFKGSFDTFNNTNNISCLAQVERVDFNNIGLQFLGSGSVFSGDIELVSQGNNADDFIGDLYIDSGKLTNKKGSFSFSQFTAQSRINNGVRFVNIRSQDVLNGLLYGKFTFSQIPAMTKNALGSYFSNFKKIELDSGHYLKFNFNVRGKIASALIPGLELNDNTFVKGFIENDNNSLQLNINAPSLKLDQTEINMLALNIDNKNPLIQGHLEFDQLKSEWLEASAFDLINSAVNDTLFFKAQYNNPDTQQAKSNLNFYFTFDNNQHPVVGIQPSVVEYRDKLWGINSKSSSRLFFDEQGYNLESTILSNASSELVVGIEKKDHQFINADFKKVKLSDLIPQSPKFQIDGLADGSFILRNDKNSLDSDSKMSIDDFTFNGADLGTATLQLQSNTSERYTMSFITQSGGHYTSEIKGDLLYPSLGEATLDLTADFKSFPAKSLQNLMGKSFDHVEGQLDGKLHIGGYLNQPLVYGDLFLNKFSFDVPYLGVSYDFPQDIQLVVTPDVFEFMSAPVTDNVYNSQGLVKGKLTHDNFKNFTPDFTISSDRMLILDTDFNPQSNYFGTAFMNGSVRIYGDTQNINFDITAQTAKGTNISIPILEATALEDATYIRFLDKTKDDKKNILSVKEVKGVSLYFDLDVTPDAQLEIVVDTETGSTLSGTGVGNILMEINSDGIFNIWGDYIALDGTYDFKNLGIIEKKFSVQPGGTILWNGDPYAAQINMQAVYEVPGGANPTVLVETTGINRKIPTEVTVNLNGTLLNFETPTFSIDFPNASASLRNELEYRLIDDERRQLQAISLLSQGIFISQFSLSALSTQTLTNNLFQKASGVFESIFSGDEDKMNIGLDYLQGDRNAAATVQTRDRLGLTLETQISERMLINGKVGVPVGGVEETIIVGDVTIEFLLNNDGSLRARIFNRENEFQYFGDDLGYTQGIGLSYKVEFNDFKSLIKKIIKKNAVL